MMKKLIFCFDGTCNAPEDSADFFEDTSISNVLKLHAFFGGKLSPKNGVNATLSQQQLTFWKGMIFIFLVLVGVPPLRVCLPLIYPIMLSF
jgi:hypothetical protein